MRNLLRRIWTWTRRLVLLGVLAAVVAAVGGWLWLKLAILPELPTDLSAYRSWRPVTSCRVYDHEQQLVDEFYVERRIWVPLAELPDPVWQAFVAAEDRRFMMHSGVDWKGIARAFWVNLESARIRQGGSTITQQLVKNLLVGSERSYERKVREAVLAVRLERELTKRAILELYLNYVYLGSGSYGVEAAARDYFGVSAREIDAGQAALLAGLVPAPSRYSPRADPEIARERRALVLRRMVQDGYLEAEAATAFEDDPVLVEDQQERESEGANANLAYLTVVRRELRRVAGSEIPFRRGLTVYTPLHAELQAVASDAVRNAVEAMEERQGRRGAVDHLEGDEAHAGFLKRAAGLERDAAGGEVLPPEPGDCFPVLVGPDGPAGELYAGPHAFALQEEDLALSVRPRGEGKAGPLREVVGYGDVLDVCRIEAGDASQVRLDPRPWGEGAAVVMENATGRVLALVGGYEPVLEGWVRATQARRQPGSSFKPYVYAAALLGGHSQLETVNDAPLSLPAGGGRTWSPRNYGGKYYGELPLRFALARSLNTVAVRLTMDVGPEAVARLAARMGVTTELRTDATIALGSSEVTPLDQARGYATIARLGRPVEPVFIDQLVDMDYQEIGRAGEAVVVGDQTLGTLPGKPGPRALPAGVAYELLDMMREVIRSGTGRRAWDPQRDRIGKTGTTNDFVDTWFVGATPRHTVAVWVGSDSHRSLGWGETGGRTALPAWLAIVEALDEPAGERFPVPDEALLVRAHERWVGLRRGGVPAEVLGLEPLGEAPLPRLEGPPPEPLPGEWKGESGPDDAARSGGGMLQ